MKQTQLYSKRQPEPVCQPERFEGMLEGWMLKVGT
jgi:hypothetical protein